MMICQQAVSSVIVSEALSQFISYWHGFGYRKTQINIFTKAPPEISTWNFGESKVD
jgi:hypothetical protein